MSTRSLTPRGLTEPQAPPNDGDVWVYNLAIDAWQPEPLAVYSLLVDANGTPILDANGQHIYG